MELQGNHTAAEFYKKRGKMMYILRQEYQCGWCPLGLIVKKVGMDTYQEMLRQERQSPEYDKRLEWNSTAVRALSKAERFELMKKTAIDEANAEIAAYEEGLELPTTGGKNCISSGSVGRLEDEKPPWQKTPPKFEVDLEEEEESEASVPCENDDEEVGIVSERIRRKARLRASSSRAPEMESLAPLKRKRTPEA